MNKRNNNKKNFNGKRRRFPNPLQREKLNQLVLRLLQLAQDEPSNPNEEWQQYEAIQTQLQLILKQEEPIQRVVCPPQVDDQTRLAKIAAFSEWAKAGGIHSDGVEIAIFPGYQMGLRATKDINADQQVLRVPRKKIFSEEQLSKTERESFCNFTTNFNLANALVVEKSRGADSIWKPYIDVLPSRYNTVLYFTVEQMRRLRGTSVCSSALRQCRMIARKYAKLYAFAYCDSSYLRPDTGLFTQHGLCYELYRWAVSTVMTRQNLVPREIATKDDGNSPISALIPCWDMANHRPGKITSFYDSNAHQMECTAQEFCKAGNQFFIYYGDRPNADLLVHNGFVDPNNNKDFVNIRLGLSPTDGLAEKRSRLLDRLNIEHKGEFRVLPAPEYISGQLLAFVRVFNMSSDQLDHWCSDLERAVDLLHIDCALETDLETRTWQYFHQRFKLLLGVLEATLREADELKQMAELQLAEAQADKQQQQDQGIDLMLLQYRRLERRILSDALEYAKERCKV
ncbi:actin-histidine N-methyltransferase [Drosophila willistoni]|nr:actin-histidine N-methyltransferase [Drosophila willistoni]